MRRQCRALVVRWRGIDVGRPLVKMRVKGRIAIVLGVLTGCARLCFSQYATPDPTSPFYDRNGNRISIGQAMDQGGTVRLEAGANRPNQSVNRSDKTKSWLNMIRDLASVLPRMTTEEEARKIVDEEECARFHEGKQRQLESIESELSRMPSLPESLVKSCFWVQAIAHGLSELTPPTAMMMSGLEMARRGVNDLYYGDGRLSVADDLSYASGVASPAADGVKKVADGYLEGKNVKDARWMRPADGAKVKQASVVSKTAGAVGYAASAYGAATDGLSLGEKYAKIETLYEKKRQLESRQESLLRQTCPVCGGY